MHNFDHHFALAFYLSLFFGSPGISRGSTFSQTVGVTVTDSAWCNFRRFRRGRALIWQPITMPPAIATNPATELRSGYGGRIGTNSGGGVRFGTTL